MSLGSGSGFDTGLWDLFGFDVKSSTPEMAKAITLLVLLMRRDKALDIPKARYYATLDQGAEFPQVVITFDEVTIPRRGVGGWRREEARVHVWFRFRGARHMTFGGLARYAERLAAILEEHPRLGDATGETAVNLAKVESWKPLYGQGANFVEDVADVVVKLVLHRRI